MAEDSSYAQAASRIKEESKPPSKSCGQLMHKTQSTCSQTQNHQEPDMEKLCKEGSECHGLVHDAKDSCPPEVGMELDEVMEACEAGLSDGEPETKQERAEVAEVEEGLEQGLIEATHGPSKECRGAMMKLPGVCGLQESRPDLDKICGKKGPCQDAMEEVTKSCKPAFASQILSFKGMCDPCTMKLSSMPRECQQSSPGLPTGKCKDHMCDVSEACKDAEEVMGMGRAQVEMFKASLSKITQLLSCGGN